MATVKSNQIVVELRGKKNKISTGLIEVSEEVLIE